MEFEQIRSNERVLYSDCSTETDTLDHDPMINITDSNMQSHSLRFVMCLLQLLKLMQKSSIWRHDDTQRHTTERILLRAYLFNVYQNHKLLLIVSQ